MKGQRIPWLLSLVFALSGTASPAVETGAVEIGAPAKAATEKAVIGNGVDLVVNQDFSPPGISDQAVQWYPLRGRSHTARLTLQSDSLRRLGLQLGGLTDSISTNRASGVTSIDIELFASPNAKVGLDQLGSLQRFSEALWQLKTDVVLVSNRMRIPLQSLRLRGVDSEIGEFDWVDERNQVWFQSRHMMHIPAKPFLRYELLSSNLYLGPHLKKMLGLKHTSVVFLGDLSFEFEVASTKVSNKSATNPLWPGSPNTVTDVILENMLPEYVKCSDSLRNVGACDGPGGDNGLVSFSPNAYLRNGNLYDSGVSPPRQITTDVPWYTKFSPPAQPYNNDQHPYLIWNLYRLNAQGQLDQIARSGLKHAFATANTNCNTLFGNYPQGFAHLLGPNCGDQYNSGSNEINNALASRLDLIPFGGQWGRCMSRHDRRNNTTNASECDGLQDSDVNNIHAMDYRLTARETDLEPLSNADARYFLEAWYVVRGDENILNTMGNTEFVPFWNEQFLVPSWTVDQVQSFQLGPAIHRFVPLGTNTATAKHSVLSTAEGALHVAVKVVQLAPNRFRYDYAVMNLDLMRATTSGDAPNVRILSNHGITGVIWPVRVGVIATEFFDGDGNSNTDWTMAQQSTRFEAAAPIGESLIWGTMYRFSLYSVFPPVAGNLSLQMNQTTLPTSYSISSLVPDQSALLFADGFE